MACRELSRGELAAALYIVYIAVLKRAEEEKASQFLQTARQAHEGLVKEVDAKALEEAVKCLEDLQCGETAVKVLNCVFEILCVDCM